MNKKTINGNGIWIRTLSKMRAYCSMFYNFSTFITPSFCVWCAKYLAFGTFERADENALSPSVKICDFPFFFFFFIVGMSIVSEPCWKKKLIVKDTARTPESDESYWSRCPTHVKHQHNAKNAISVQPRVWGHFESSITEEINDKGSEFEGLGNSFEGLVEIWVVEAWG